MTFLAKHTWVGVAFMVAVMVSVCAGHSTLAQPLPGYLKSAEVGTLLAGNTMAGNGVKKDPAEPYDWIANYHKDGKVRLQLKPAWGGGVSKGKWWMKEDGQTCRKFETGHKKEGCWRVYREGKFIRMRLSSGTGVDVFAIVIPGHIELPKAK